MSETYTDLSELMAAVGDAAVEEAKRHAEAAHTDNSWQDRGDDAVGKLFKEIASIADSCLLNGESFSMEKLVPLGYRWIKEHLPNCNIEEATTAASHLLAALTLAVRAEHTNFMYEKIRDVEGAIQPAMDRIRLRQEHLTEKMIAYSNSLRDQHAENVRKGAESRHKKTAQVRKFAIELYEKEKTLFASASDAAKTLAQDVLNFAVEIGAQNRRDYRDVFQVRDTVARWLREHRKLASVEQA